MKSRPSYTITLIKLIAFVSGIVTSSYALAEPPSSCFDSDGNLLFGTDCVTEQNQAESDSEEGHEEPFSLELKRVNPEQFEAQEPNWEPVTAEFSVTGVTVDECCLRAIRGTKERADEMCRAKGKSSWQVVSITPKEAPEKPYKTIQNCYVYAEKRMDSQYLFSCHARALSKCAWQWEFKF